ncbi:tetratricopeptide repeat protein [Pedobacter sp. BS3]|uniref:tetratricopeptide repeat protein n=1 Tax=Pedobacter sp. BS3 TaxID=2567937 RepID=UPI0011EE27FA|nr:tetratricopeptide repeat protein [Pedobacter sp. BS3]TZF81533.1 tetratricopeptide repeat protein [Pedobacter sp. BS3]
METYSFEDISRFADGEMTGEELTRFEERLQQDENLRNEVAFYRNVQSSLRMKLVKDDQDKALEDTLHRLSKEHSSRTAKIVPMRRYAAWASAVAAVFVIFMVWMPWKKDLYQQYNTTEMLTTAERGDATTNNMQTAADAFNNKDFEKAKTLLAQVVQAEPDNSMARFYYGVSLLETGDIAQSRKTLADVYQGASVFKYEAAFYIALSYLKQHDKSHCKEWLIKIPTDAANYDKAQELLGKL